MTDLIIEIEETEGSNVWVDHRARFTNETGTPLVSAEPNVSGSAIADVYTLTFTDVTPGVSATVLVSASSRNPYNTDEGWIVDLDGETVYAGIIGGVDLVFSDDESFDFTWQAEVRVGLYFGRRREGQTSIARRIRARNDSLVTLSDAKASIKKRVKPFPKTGTVFERVKGFAAGATVKLVDGSVSPYVITVENKTGSGSGITADIKADGELLNVVSLADEDETEITSEELNVTDFYRVTDGDMTGFIFRLSQSILNTSVCNILIHDSSFSQTAPDVDGDPGDWGTTDVDFTEEGEDAGVITAGGVSAPIHARAVLPGGANSISNPFVLDIEVSASVADGAGWDA